METISRLSESFWNEDIWTPPNATWALYEERGYRRFNDLYYSAFTAILVVIIRVILDRFVYTPIGIWFGLSATRPQPPPANRILEDAYRKTRGKLNESQLQGLAKQLDCSPRKIQRWMRTRSAQNKPTVLCKFTESAWRCTFYCVMFIYGLFVLWDKPWMWDTTYAIVGYPHHYVSREEWWYYNIETAFYLSLLFSQFTDVKRKDFWVMFVHHVVTLCLLSFSWACNIIRLGTLVLVIHDFADIPLEGAKMFSYINKQKIADITFNVFALSWIISRIGLLPYRIIYYSSYVALGLTAMFPAYYIFNALLIILQTLHIIWTYFIVRVAIIAWNNNGIKDIRSDDEEDDEPDFEDEEVEEDDLSFTDDATAKTQIGSNGNNTHRRKLSAEQRPGNGVTKAHLNGSTPMVNHH